MKYLLSSISITNSFCLSSCRLNFSRVARMVDENGSVVILKNNKPRYLIVKFNAAEREELVKDMKGILSVSNRLIEKNKQAYEALAK